MKQLFTFLFSILLLGNSSAQEKPVSTEFGIFSSQIEKEFNKRNRQIDINTNISVVLNFDSLGHFFLLDSSAYYPKEAFAMAKLLKELDRKKGILSQNPIFSDTSLIYTLTTLMDSELQRAWFTRISTNPKSENYHIFDREGFYVPPQPPGGGRNLLDYIANHIKSRNLEHYISALDTPWLSFIVVSDGSTLDTKINGDSPPNVQGILNDLGKWTPAIHYGRPVDILFKIDFNKEKETNRLNSRDMGIISMGQVFRGIPYNGYLIVSEYLHKENLKNDESLIVSFVYQSGLTAILGPVTLKGSKRNGRKLIKLIIKHLANSNINQFPGPSRFYVIVDENKVMGWPNF
jgi:hypothetical protein